MIRHVFPLFLCVTVAAPPALAEITAEQVSGKTLVTKGGTFVVGADGSLSGTVGKGDKVVGTWQVKAGQWCRAINAPERLAGSTCQVASIEGKTLTVTRDDGAKVTLQIK